MKLLDLDLLHTFILAVEKNSFAKAANHVHRSQSAVSLQMQRLEELTGQQLFVKQGRHWQLTGYGEVLLGYARQMLDINHAAIEALSASPLTGPVRLGMRIDYLEGGLSKILGEFAVAYPAVQIEITVDKEDVLLQRIQSGKLDVIANFGKTLPDDAIPVGSTPLRWIGNGDLSVAKKEPLPLLLFEAPCLFREAAINALSNTGIAWRPALTASSVAGMWAAAQAGLGIAVRTAIGLPAGCKIVSPSANLPSLPSIDLFLVKQKEKNSPVIERLIEIIRQSLLEQLEGISGSGV